MEEQQDAHVKAYLEYKKLMEPHICCGFGSPVCKIPKLLKKQAD